MTEVYLERLGAEHNAIGRLDSGKTVFVPYGCPGDTVEVEITDEKERYAIGTITNIVESSPHRIEPTCPYFGECGGCDWQHIDYPTQLQAKRDIVVNAFQRIGKLPDTAAAVSPTVAPSREYHYRNKIELVCATVNGKLELGYHKRGTNQIVSVDACPLLSKKGRKLPKALKGLLRYLSGNEDLGIERVAIRCALNSSDIEVALYTGATHFPRAMVTTMLKQTCPEVKSIVRVLMKDKAGTRKVSSVEVLAGKGFWREEIGKQQYMVSAPSFFQVNTKGAEALVDTVLSYLEPDGTDIALDLYSGVGTFTLPLSELAGDTMAIESYGPAVRDLRRNLDASQLWADVIGGDAAREIADAGHVDIAVVDPPRAGLASEVIDALIQNKPRKLAYVSCDPATLARDARLLVDGGFVIEQVIPVDMFPQTHHVETVVLMSRVNK